jgi:hypothetical protein
MNQARQEDIDAILSITGTLAKGNTPRVLAMDLAIIAVYALRRLDYDQNFAVEYIEWRRSLAKYVQNAQTQTTNN